MLNFKKKKLEVIQDSCWKRRELDLCQLGGTFVMVQQYTNACELLLVWMFDKCLVKAVVILLSAHTIHRWHCILQSKSNLLWPLVFYFAFEI